MREDKLPAGWVWATLGEVAESISSGFPTGKHNNEGMGVPHLRPMNINVGGEIDLTVIRYVEDTEYQPLQHGDILFNNTNSTELVGKTAVVLEDTNWLYSNHMTRIKVPDGLVEPRYISYFLQSLFLNGVFKENSKQHVNQASIGRDFLLNLKIPLSPLADQVRIAKLLDRLMEQLRSAQTALAEVPGLLRQFRQKVLAMGMRGELTREWRSKKNGEDNLIEFENKEKDEKGWYFFKAQEACTVVQSGVTPKGKPFTDKGDIPFLKVYNIVNQEIDFDYKPQFIPRNVHLGEAKRSIAYPNDIVMNIVGPPLGKVAMLSEQYPEWNMNQAITLFRCKEWLLPKFLYYFLCEGTQIKAISNDYRGVAGQSNISLSQCRSLILPVPPINEQREILRQIDHFFALSDQLEFDYEAAKSQLDALPQSVLSKAFRGELCTPEPGAESAEILLARIQKEKARLEILEKQQRSQRQARKMKSEKKSDLKALAAVLETSKGEWILSRMAWQQSEHRDDIEGFYAELKRLIETEQMVEEEKRGKESYLRMTQA